MPTPDHPDEAPSVVDLSPATRPTPSSLVRPAADLSDIEAAFVAYTAMCDRLLVAEDYQRIGSKDFRKKSAWRKLAVAFGVSVALVDRDYERDSRGRILRAEIVSRATAPGSGRFMDGLGACDVTERCCPQAHGGSCTMGGYHTHCEQGCEGFVHFSKPGHDIPATAHTRATNRACADLFGMGEVSAEEVSVSDVVGGHPAPVTPAGFVSGEEATEAHTHLAERIKALPPEIDREPFRHFKDEFGWPMPKAALVILDRLLDDAINQYEDAKAQGGPEAAQEAQEGSGPPDPHPEGSQAQDGPAKAESDDEDGELCTGCAEDVPPDHEGPPPGRRAVFDEQGDVWHAACAPFDTEPVPEFDVDPPGETIGDRMAADPDAPFVATVEEAAGLPPAETVPVGPEHAAAPPKAKRTRKASS